MVPFTQSAANNQGEDLQVLKAHISVPTMEAMKIEGGKNSSNNEKPGQEKLHLHRQSQTLKRNKAQDFHRLG